MEYFPEGKILVLDSNVEVEALLYTMEHNPKATLKDVARVAYFMELFKGIEKERGLQDGAPAEQQPGEEAPAVSPGPEDPSPDA